MSIVYHAEFDLEEAVKLWELYKETLSNRLVDAAFEAAGESGIAPEVLENAEASVVVRPYTPDKLKFVVEIEAPEVPVG